MSFVVHALVYLTVCQLPSKVACKVVALIPAYVARLPAGSTAERSRQAQWLVDRLRVFITHIDPAVQEGIAISFGHLFCMLALPCTGTAGFLTPASKNWPGQQNDFEPPRLHCPDCDRLLADKSSVPPGSIPHSSLHRCPGGDNFIDFDIA
jgi:hypothetical protein